MCIMLTGKISEISEISYGFIYKLVFFVLKVRNNNKNVLMGREINKLSLYTELSIKNRKKQNEGNNIILKFSTKLSEIIKYIILYEGKYLIAINKNKNLSTLSFFFNFFISLWILNFTREPHLSIILDHTFFMSYVEL